MVEVLNIKEWLENSDRQYNKIGTQQAKRLKDGEMFFLGQAVERYGFNFKLACWHENLTVVGVVPIFDTLNWDLRFLSINTLTPLI